ncbi:AAA family ATPase [Bacillus spizizenii]|nr:AAA family ATPase [Bacillus spizizenii]MCY8890467.1 AAA family ATPase [Bacillus spizizenii]MEC0841922.1 AAA family ATPase [Bacillus spizizenii]
MAKPIVLTCANHKGGSGKSSLAGSLIIALAEQGYRVLGIDGDMQRNLSTTYGLREFGKEKNLYRAIEDIDELENFNGAEYIVKTDYENVDFIVSHEDMALLETSLMLKMAEREKYVSKLIESISETENYDFVVFDTNPTLGVLNFNIFVASDYVIIPVECSAYGVDGLGAILKFYKNTSRVNKNLKIGGIVMSKVDLRKSIAKDAIEVVKDMFGDVIFDTMISTDTSVEKSQWDEEPLLTHSPDSRAANQYRELTKEVLSVVGKKRVLQN